MANAQHPAELAIVTMPPQLDATNAGQAGDDLAGALVPGVVAVVADLTATTFCDSSAAAMLVRAHLRATGHHAELRLVTCSRAVLRALAIAIVDYSLPVYPSLAAALIPRPAPPASKPAPRQWPGATRS